MFRFVAGFNLWDVSLAFVTADRRDRNRLAANFRLQTPGTRRLEAISYNHDRSSRQVLRRLHQEEMHPTGTFLSIAAGYSDSAELLG